MLTSFAAPCVCFGPESRVLLDVSCLGPPHHLENLSVFVQGLQFLDLLFGKSSLLLSCQLIGVRAALERETLKSCFKAALLIVVVLKRSLSSFHS